MNALARRAKNQLLGCFTVAALLASGAAAQGDRPWSIEPELRASLVWDDNVTHDGADPRSDTALGLAPRVATEYRRKRWEVGADVGADLRLHLNESDLSDAFWRVEAHGEVEPLPGLHFRIADHYLPQPVYLGRPEDDTDNLRQSNTLIAEVRYWRELKRNTAIELGFRTTRFTTDGFPASIDVDGDGVVETDRHQTTDHWGAVAFAEVQRGFGRRVEAYLRGEYRERRYDEIDAADFDELSGVLGIRVRLGSRINGELAGGWGRIDFADLPDDDRFLGRLHLEYEPGRDWRITASLLRRLTGDANATDFDETSARLGVEKRLGRRTSFHVELWWSRFSAGAPSRGDETVLAAELRVRRRITKRIEGELAYRRWRSESDLEDDDFTQNRVTLGFVYRY